ncbi:DUF2459 domain-containing protein [Tenacibaculum agarivorans]|uniref:DUF2459 domain-containing protein n=1 Tax=Tenacibaculum agarivorans TaxID=1908389 RepID=UPI00094BACE8|nr:DUF2459 domain-containing protein [Tenacibaculum agarivorans]
MKYLKKTLKYIAYLIVSLCLYVGISILLSYITVHETPVAGADKKIYLNTNGIHLSVIVPKEYLSTTLQQELTIPITKNFVRFGWGDENFFLNVPTWNDFKFSYALGALFLDNPTLIEVSTHRFRLRRWVEVPVNSEQLTKLNLFITSTFKLDNNQKRMRIVQNMYPNSELFKANGSYSPIKTCNTWVNEAFKESGIKSSYWTLFDFGLLNKYKNDAR